MTRKLVSLLLTLAMLMCCVPASAETLPLVDEPVTVDVAVAYSSYCLVDWNDKEFYKKLGEDTGVNFRFNVINDWSTQVSLMIAGEELPDLIMGKVNDLSSNLDYFYDLTDLIYEYAPTLVKLFEEEPSVKASVTQADGGIYQLPIQHTWMLDNALGGLMWINSDWLKNVGMESPTNLEELYNVLVAFRDLDANGDGDPNNEVPFGFAENNWAGKLDDIFGSFGVLNNIWSGYTEISDDHKVIFEPEQEAYYEALQWLHKIYAEGLLDPEGFSQTSDQYAARIAQDTYGIVIHYNPISANPAFEPMKPILGARGTTLIDGNNKLSNASGYICVSANSEHAAEIVKVYEYVNSHPDLKISNRYGEQGVIWDFVGDDGEFKIADYNSQPPEGYEFWDQYIYTVGETGESGLMFFSLSDWAKNVSTKTVREEAIASYLPYFRQNYYKYMSLEEDLANELSLMYTEIEAYVKSFIADAVVNGIDDEGWSRHLETLKALNAERYVELKQMSYDAFLNTLE